MPKSKIGREIGCLDCNVRFMSFHSTTKRCEQCQKIFRKTYDHRHDKCICGNKKQIGSKMCNKCTNALPTLQRKFRDPEDRSRRYDNCICGRRKQKQSAMCVTCNNQRTAEIAREKNGTATRKRARYDFCNCGRRMRVGAIRCVFCKRDEYREEIMRDLCECGNSKIISAPYCAACTVSRAINRVNQAKAIQPKPTVYHVRRKPAPPRIEYELCQCGSEWEVRKGHQCPKCYALALGLPAPTYSQHLILDRMGNKV